jgi:hypothetical protein
VWPFVIGQYLRMPFEMPRLTEIYADNFFDEFSAVVDTLEDWFTRIELSFPEESDGISERTIGETIQHGVSRISSKWEAL